MAPNPVRITFIETLKQSFNLNPHEQWGLLRYAVKWLLLGSAAGVLSGTASALFLYILNGAVALQTAYPLLLLGLPVAGLVLGLVYTRFAGAAARGNNLVVEELNLNQSVIPRRMAPLVLFGTVLTHLFGGSAGREGTAVQMGSSLADWLQRVLKLNREDRRLLLMAGVSGGFSSVFGTPVAGAVFGLEVQSMGRIRYEGVIPCLVAAIVGDFVARAWGATHTHYPLMAASELNIELLIKTLLASIVFGLVSLLFIELTHAVKYLAGQAVRWPPFRPVVGGLIIIGLTWLLGTRDYLSLSLPLIKASLDGSGVVTFAFLFKLIFTAVTLGTGFLGGEVTPLFVIGSTLGFTLGQWLGVDPAWLAAIGFVAVFAGASNTPLACALMGIELFGGGSALYLVLGCFIAYLASGHRGIYITQTIGSLKVAGAGASLDDTLETLHHKTESAMKPNAPRKISMAEGQKVAERASTEIEAWLRELDDTVDVENVEGNAEYQARDIDLLWSAKVQASIRDYSIEIKADRWERTGNFFFETVSNKQKNTPGSFLYTEADFLFYYFVESRTLYILPMPRTRTWFLTVIEQFAERETSTPVGADHYITVGRLVPIEVVLHSVEGIKIKQL